jgi:hypothetical protein
MNQYVRRARRFFWWCAAADGAILDAPDAPRLDGIKYAAVGALVCLTTTVAACGWMHNAATMLGGEAYGLPLAAGLGLLMGALVLCMERVLVVSIRQDASVAAKVAAFVWRGVTASLAAALVTTPGESGEGNHAAMRVARYSSSHPAVFLRRRMESLPGAFRVRL